MKDYSRRKKPLPSKFRHLNIYSNDLIYLRRKIKQIRLSNIPSCRSVSREYFEYYRYLGGKTSYINIIR